MQSSSENHKHQESEQSEQTPKQGFLKRGRKKMAALLAVGTLVTGVGKGAGVMAKDIEERENKERKEWLEKFPTPSTMPTEPGQNQEGGKEKQPPKKAPEFKRDPNARTELA